MVRLGEGHTLSTGSSEGAANTSLVPKHRPTDETNKQSHTVFISH